MPYTHVMERSDLSDRFEASEGQYLFLQVCAAHCGQADAQLPSGQASQCLST